MPERQSVSARSGRGGDVSFSLLVRLPDDSLCSVKCVRNKSRVSQVKGRLELQTGFCPSTYQLLMVDNTVLNDDSRLEIGGNITTDNTILKLLPNDFYSEVYRVITGGDNSVMQAVDLYDDNVQSDDLFSILFMAAFHGNTQDCECLLDNGGVTVTQASISGNTALHAAVARDRVSTALFLCERGADIYQKNKKGSTPLDVGLDFGSFTTERKLRLSQWGRRKAKMEKTTETSYTTEFKPAENIPELKQQSAFYMNTEPTAPAVGFSRLSSTSSSDKSRCKSAVSRQNSIKTPETSQKRLARVQSAPLLNSEGRNKRLCSAMKEKTPEERQEIMRRKAFKLSRPQYLQFIKSSTGVVVEDFFADIFPEQEEEKRVSVRSFDDQMKRNERIFRKMCKESGVTHQDSDTDSEEEVVRQYANKRAVDRWTRKKQTQKQQELEKKRITPTYPADESRKQCLGELLMIGDTSKGRVTISDPQSYSGAYKSYRKEGRAKSASTVSHVGLVEPITYEEWCDMKPEPQQVCHSEHERQSIQKQELKKRIDYESWLNSANKKLSKQLSVQKKEAQQKRDFDRWVRELKDEFGTFDYWRRQKQEQKERQRRVEEARRKEEEQKAKEKEKRRELSQEIYHHWVYEKEMRKIKQEERKLQLENQRLSQLRQGKS